ncbi:MAG: hypothetical protein IPM27_11535 [Nitrosomonadales bacterium]|nr:hypothetical protein [Nitrosomonadales bacterium]
MGLGGGGLTTEALARLVGSATDHIVIQSPYLVLSGDAKELFGQTLARRRARVRINTNSRLPPATTSRLPADTATSAVHCSKWVWRFMNTNPTRKNGSR